MYNYNYTIRRFRTHFITIIECKAHGKNSSRIQMKMPSSTGGSPKKVFWRYLSRGRLQRNRYRLSSNRCFLHTCRRQTSVLSEGKTNIQWLWIRLATDVPLLLRKCWQLHAVLLCNHTKYQNTHCTPTVIMYTWYTLTVLVVKKLERMVVELDCCHAHHPRPNPHKS